MTSAQFSSVTQSCLTLCDPMDCSTPGLPVHHQLPEFTQTHVHWVGDTIQPSHPLSSPSLPAFNLSQHLGLSNESALCIRWPKYWEFKLQHQSFQWILRTDFHVVITLPILQMKELRPNKVTAQGHRPNRRPVKLILCRLMCLSLCLSHYQPALWYKIKQPFWSNREC